MISNSKKSLGSQTEYTRRFEQMRGISSKATPSKNIARFQLLDNMYVDYSNGGDSVESIPGFRKIASFKNPTNGIFEQKISSSEAYLIVHAGKYVFRIDKNDRSGSPKIKTLAVIEDVRSSAFSFGNEIYLMDGKQILRIDKNGTAVFVGEEGAEPYVPILYKDGVVYEDRNLLCDKGREIFHISDYTEHLFGSAGLKCVITDEKNKCCSVIGGNGIKDELHIPSYVKIGAYSYRVTEISPYAFKNNTGITALFTNPGLSLIGIGAFSGCSALQKAVISYTVTAIDSECFSGCSAMNELTLNYFPIEIGENAFRGCDALLSVKCAGDISAFSETTNGSGLETKTPETSPAYSALTLGLPLSRAAMNVEKVIVGIHTHDFDFDSTNRILKLSFDSESEIKDKEIMIREKLYPADKSTYDPIESFLTTDGGIKIGGLNAILGCKICESFDGRIFLSGHPSLPGVVFYSEKDKNSNFQPLYFGVRNFFTDGVANDTVSDLLSTHGRLAVFKSGDDGSGTIFYHEPKSVSGRTSYPVSYVHGSIPVYGCAVNFFDEAVFLTDRGVCALEKVSGSDYKEVRCRSEAISSLLLRESLSDASVTEWQGYLVLAVGERFYLADSRDTYNEEGVLQYEWYRLTDVGTYNDDRRVYRYSSTPISGYGLSNTPDQRVMGTVFSEPLGEETVYFTNENGVKLAVYPTEEFEGGEFDPAVLVFSDGELLYFGTASGELCLFNSDLRGIPPKEISEKPDFSAEEYQKAMGSRIHPSYYSFASHRVNYGVVTAFDDCESPHMSKNTVRDSTVIKFKVFEQSRVSVDVETELGQKRRLAEIPLSSPSFDGIGFSELTASLSDFTSVIIPEKERGWTEKRYLIRSDGFCSPFGIYSISYRYKIKGKIRQ